MREYWQSFEVDLVNYQNRTKLIRGWDDLFSKLKEHMNSLTAMKLSPYYKQFEEVSLFRMLNNIVILKRNNTKRGLYALDSYAAVEYIRPVLV